MTKFLSPAHEAACKNVAVRNQAQYEEHTRKVFQKFVKCSAQEAGFHFRPLKAR